MSQPTPRPQWASSLTFILAAMGAAIGPGSLWKFPYLVGTNGGGGFILIYIIALLLIAIPIQVLELFIGRYSKSDVPDSIAKAAVDMGTSRKWASAGWTGILSSFLICSLYSLIIGWGFYYFFLYTMDLSVPTVDASRGHFNNMVSDPILLTILHTLVIGITVFIVALGIKKGIEKAVTLLMPPLFVAVALLAVYSSISGNFIETVRYLFIPDFSTITIHTVMMAVGQAFFSVSVGNATMIAYGSYIGKDINLARSSFLIVGANTAVALIAGFIIFPIVFANGISVAEGPGLAFVSLPIAFSLMPGGQFVGLGFFALFIFAAMTSMIGVMEPTVSLIVKRIKITRVRASLLVGIAAWGVGFISVLSFGVLSGVYPLHWLSGFQTATLFDVTDFMNVTILIPLNCLLLVIMAAYFMKKDILLREANLQNQTLTQLWYFMIKYIAPTGLILLLLFGLRIL